jgi:hypothetical protein
LASTHCPSPSAMRMASGEPVTMAAAIEGSKGAPAGDVTDQAFPINASMAAGIPARENGLSR